MLTKGIVTYFSETNSTIVGFSFGTIYEYFTHKIVDNSENKTNTVCEN